MRFGPEVAAEIRKGVLFPREKNAFLIEPRL
jgi:hypothetical protein